MKVSPVSDALGGQLQEFDATRPCTLREQAELRDLFCEYHLLVVPNTMTAQDHDRLVSYLGPLQMMPNDTRAEYVTNQDDPLANKTPQGRLLFHCDGGYGARPGIATSLWAQAVSPTSPPTMFASAVRALSRIPAALRSRLEGLHAVHMTQRNRPPGEPQRRVREWYRPADAALGRYLRYERPVVAKPPHTDTHTLYVNETLTSHITELSPAESEDLLQELYSFLYADENLYTHTWHTNDLVVWDNWALQHARPAEVGPAPRHLRRLSLDGWNTGNGVLEWPAVHIAAQPPTR